MTIPRAEMIRMTDQFQRLSASRSTAAVSKWHQEMLRMLSRMQDRKMFRLHLGMLSRIVWMKSVRRMNLPGKP